MTRGDGTTYDTDAHVEWGFIVEDWPKPGMSSFIAMPNETDARRYCESQHAFHPSSIYGQKPRRLAQRMIGHAEEVKIDD